MDKLQRTSGIPPRLPRKMNLSVKYLPRFCPEISLTYPDFDKWETKRSAKNFLPPIKFPSGQTFWVSVNRKTTRTATGKSEKKIEKPSAGILAI